MDSQLKAHYSENSSPPLTIIPKTSLLYSH